MFDIQSQVNNMIYDFITNECWVDGSVSIPSIGCDNFMLSSNVNKTLLDFRR